MTKMQKLEDTHHNIRPKFTLTESKKSLIMTDFETMFSNVMRSLSWQLSEVVDSLFTKST